MTGPRNRENRADAAAVILRGGYERMGQLPLSLEDLTNLARRCVRAEEALQDEERTNQRLASHLAEAEAEAESKGWQAEWTKVRKREQKLRQVVMAARPLVDDDEWQEHAEEVLCDRPT